MISGPPEERALLAAEAAAQTGRVEEAAAALAGTAEQTAAYQAALSLARARWEECRGALGAAQRHALDATGEASGVPALAALAWLAAGRVYLSSGEPKRAHDCLGRAADLIADNWPLGQRLLAVAQARLAIFRGDLAEARQALGGATASDVVSAVELGCAQGLLHSFSAAFSEAARHYVAAAALAGRERLPYLWATATLGAADAALDGGASQEVPRWLAEVQSTVAARGFQRLHAHLFRLRGRMLRAHGDHPGAVAAFIEALRMFIALEDRLGVACTDLAFGAMLVRVPGAGDPRRGLFLLEEARGIFERAGAVLLARRAAALATP